MKMWIARGEDDNYCILFKEKPYKYYDGFCKKHFFKTDNMYGTYMCLPEDDFPSVTFENSPMEVELKIKHNEMRFSSMFRLFDRIVIKDPSDRKRIVKYTEKLIDKLKEEGFYADAKCAEEYLKVFNGELVELIIKKKEQD